LSWFSAVSAFSLSAFQLLPKCGLGWLCPAVQGSKFEVQGSRFAVYHKCPESNSPAAPPSGCSGDTLDIPWTYPGTIDPLPDPVFDQARLSKSVSCGSSARSRYSALDVGGSRFEVGCHGNERLPPGIPRFGRLPTSASLRRIQDATRMTSRRGEEDQQNHGRTESYGPAFYDSASNDSGFAPHESVLR
jgi:hypothetical protein